MRRRQKEAMRREALWSAPRKFDSIWQSWQSIRDYRVKSLVERVQKLEASLADPEGTIQRGINERYVNDLREREMAHHAAWDAEVVVHKMAAARWMRSCVLGIVTDAGMREAIERLPLVPGEE